VTQCDGFFQLPGVNMTMMKTVAVAALVALGAQGAFA
jgi:hypothetical protein